jgi:hypothetical protein
LKALGKQQDFFNDGRMRRLAPTGFKKKSVQVKGKSLHVTPVFSAYWRFAAERQEIFFRRLRGNGSAGLTDDPILARYKFTNAYRASDRVSQYLIRHVIYRDDLPNDAKNLFYRILLFKLFNKIETWEILESELGPLTWESYNFSQIDRVLSKNMKECKRIYSAAYIMPSAGGAYGYPEKHRNHLRLIEHMMAEDFPARLTEAKSMKDAFGILRNAHSIGPFLAYQFVTDLNYSPLTLFNEDEFVVAGPGALDGIQKCFVNADEFEPSDIIKYMYDSQLDNFEENQLTFSDLWGRPLQLIDCQNIFCEISKYSRVAFPEYAGSTGRTRIKQLFSPKGAIPTPWYPPRWQINAKIRPPSSS